MKLHLNILNKLIELPSDDIHELRHVFDDLGLELKDVEETPSLVLNIETLANRGDHLSALGMAREFSARYLTRINYPALANELPSKPTSVPVTIDTEMCYRYALLEMTLPSELSLPKIVADTMVGDSELAKHHPIVDLLNFILLELGQPMHAFDFDKVDGTISVVLSSEEEEIEALDNNIYTVPANSILIRDASKIIAVAGVIGCANSMVTPGTKRVLIESATFDPVAVRKTAKSMGISTDASYVFERGADQEMVITALKRLAALTEGAVDSVHDGNSAHCLSLLDVVKKPLIQKTIQLNIQTIRKEVNLPRLEPATITSRLKNLGYTVSTVEKDKVFDLTVPSWRVWDVKEEDDLIEDFVRSHGFNTVKAMLPPLDPEQPEMNQIDRIRTATESALLGNGFYEVITQSIYPIEEVQLLESLEPEVFDKHISIKNAVEKAFSHLKITNILHLSRLLEQNRRKDVSSCKVYEIGKYFFLDKVDSDLYEQEKDFLTFAISGRWNDSDWKKPETREELAMRFKGVVGLVVRSLGCTYSLSSAKNPYLHPGYQSSVKVGRSIVGSFGMVHPLLIEKLDIKGDVFYAEFDIELLLKGSGKSQFKQPTDYPSIKRDVTLKISRQSLASHVNKLILDLDPHYLSSIDIVDLFEKQEEDFRRITYRLTFKSDERTLQHQEIDEIMEQILVGLKSREIEQL